MIHDAIHDPKNLAYASTHPRAVMGSHKRSAGILAAHDDVDEVVKKAADAKRKAKSALERAAKAERYANKIQQSERKLLERLKFLQHQTFFVHSQRAQPQPMSSAGRAIGLRGSAFGIETRA